MTKFIITNELKQTTKEITVDYEFDIDIYGISDIFFINEICYGLVLKIDYKDNIIYTDENYLIKIHHIKEEDINKYNIADLINYAKLNSENYNDTLMTEKLNNDIDTENTVIFKPINKYSNGYLHLIEDAEYTIDFLDVEDNLVYLFDYNDTIFHASDFINKNTKLRLTEYDKEDEHNFEKYKHEYFEKYKDGDFSIDDNKSNIKYPETSSFIETHYNSCISEIDDITVKIIEKRKQKAILDKEISDLETNILDERKMKEKFEIMLNELKQ